jgi:thiol-disulfide isomerase/thioredoxin
MDLLGRILILLAVGVAAGLATRLATRYFKDASFPLTFDRQDLGYRSDQPAIVEFTTPYCYECKEALPLLKAASKVYDIPLAVIDAKERPDLASKYSVRSTPTILLVDNAGNVTDGWLKSPDESEFRAALESAILRPALG